MSFDLTSDGGLLIYRELDDTERLSIDPAKRPLIGGRAKQRQAACPEDIPTTSIISYFTLSPHLGLSQAGDE